MFEINLALLVSGSILIGYAANSFVIGLGVAFLFLFLKD